MMNSILIIGFCLTTFFSIFVVIETFAQTRDLEAEYCTKNWITDQIRCAQYIPEDYPENPKYELEEAEKTRQDVQQIKSEQEAQRVCPLGSHITTDNQGNQICVDSTGKFTGYPNLPDTGFGDDTALYIGIGIVIIIIVAGVGMAMKKKSEPLSYKEMPRRDFSPEVEEQTLKNQNNKCNDCGTPIGQVGSRLVFYDFDHIDGNHFNNEPSNCQALCKNCHAKKTERERGMYRN